MSVVMTRLDALRGLLAMSEDYRDVDPICERCREPESACLCESDLLGDVERLTRIVRDLSAEVESLKQGDREAAELAERVIQAVTLAEAKSAARIYLGLQEPF